MENQGCLGRIGTIFTGVLILLAAQVLVAAGYDRYLDNVTPAMTAQTVAHEVARARANGLTQVAERTVQNHSEEEITLRPGGCFSLVASATGNTPLAPMVIRDEAGRAVGGDPHIAASDFVRHASWCSLHGGRFTVTIYGGTSLHILRFEGQPPRASWPLARTQPTPNMIATLRQELTTARFDAARAGQTSLAAWVGASTAEARLLPESPATVALLRASRALSPRDALPSPAQPATLTLLGDTLRTVAALDVGAFHRRCVTLRVMPATASPEPLYRVEVPGWRVQALASQDGFFTDRRCVTDPLVVYAVRANTDVSLRFALDADPGPEDPSLVASAWRGETVPHSLFSRLQAECVRDASACMTLGFLGGSAIPAPLRPDALAAFRQACTLDHAEGCARFASAVRDPVASQEHLGRACELGMASACVQHAERARLALEGVPFDAAVAMASYERGCTLGDTTACHQRDTMRLLQLAP